ncbi:MAG: ATP-binding protein, partial [Actinomycetota bacterium]
MSERPIPTPSLLVLVGPPASGKSTWAAEHFRPEQIVSADALRGVVGEHEFDLSASEDAFDLLDRIVAARLGRGLTTVIDTTGLDSARRAVALTAARSASVPAVAVRFTTSAAECK